jgi:hypothetical protein
MEELDQQPIDAVGHVILDPVTGVRNALDAQVWHPAIQPACQGAAQEGVLFMAADVAASAATITSDWPL